MKIVAIGGTGLRGGRPGVGGLIDGAQLKGYPGAPHGITDTHKGSSAPSCSSS